MKDGITEVELDAASAVPRLIVTGDIETLRALAGDLSKPRGGPWTRHGHSVPGVTVAGGHPAMVARCGGPAICSDCALDAERLRREHAGG